MTKTKQHHLTTAARRALKGIAVGLLWLTSAPGSVHAGPRWQFTTVDVPDAIVTYANGNAARAIVGEFDDANGTHGFLRKKHGIALFDVPGADGYTSVNGANGRGEHVGIYIAGDRPYGYFWKDGVVTTLDPPGATWSVAQFVNRLHQVTGYAKDGEGTRHGFVWRDGVFTPVDAPGAGSYGTKVVGINDRKDVVGSYRDGENRHHGFLFSRGVYTTIDMPGSLEGDGFTDAQGINDRGEIAGYYAAADGTSHGFVIGNGLYTTVDVPDAYWTEIYSINAVGDVVGEFEDASGIHAMTGKRLR